jgi:tetratricopeptide (TPR) repeat protein
VRISVQLIDADTDQPIWSDRFDRQLTDLFALQEDVAQAVVDALAEPLGVRTVTVRRATEDLEAYALYLRGRQLFALRGANLEPARSLLNQAVERDTQFAEAWASLAGTLYVMPAYFPDAAPELYRESAAAAARALALLPEQPDALAVRSRLAADGGEREQALALIERALARDPNNANSWMWKGLAQLEVGHVAAARESFARGQRLDPLSGIHFGWLGATELIHGEHAAARTHLERAHALGWRGPASAWLLKLALIQGDADAIDRHYADWVRDDGRITATARPIHLQVAAAASDPAQREVVAAKLVQAVAEQPDYDWSTLMLFLGLTDAAIDETLRAKPASGQVLLMMIWSAADRPFRQHPRFAEVAAHHGLPAFWSTQGAPDGCRWSEPPPRLECDR